MRTAVQGTELDGFTVLRCTGHQDTANTLARTTAAIARQYQSRSLAVAAAARLGGGAGSGGGPMAHGAAAGGCGGAAAGAGAGTGTVGDEDPLESFYEWDERQKAVRRAEKVQAVWGLMLCAVPGAHGEGGGIGGGLGLESRGWVGGAALTGG